MLVPHFLQYISFVLPSGVPVSADDKSNSSDFPYGNTIEKHSLFCRILPANLRGRRTRRRRLQSETPQSPHRLGTARVQAAAYVRRERRNRKPYRSPALSRKWLIRKSLSAGPIADGATSYLARVCSKAARLYRRTRSFRAGPPINPRRQNTLITLVRYPSRWSGAAANPGWPGRQPLWRESGKRSTTRASPTSPQV